MKPIEVLLIEDNPADATLIAAILHEIENANHLTVVPNGIEALEFLRKEEKYGGALAPDLIVVDLNLPRMSGQELLEELQADTCLKEIPIVILTGSIDTADKMELEQWPIYQYIIKPSDLDDYIHHFQTLMNDFHPRN